MSLKKVLCFHQCRRHKPSHASGTTASSEECRHYTLAAGHSTTRLALETFAALLFIWIFTVPTIAQRLQKAAAPNSEITISVHDYADVPPLRLAAAEAEARRIFGLAGVKTVWLSCSPKLEKSQSADCSTVDATHLVLKILSGKTTVHVHDRDDVLGNALLADNGVGYYAYAFLDHIETLEQHLGFPVLGYVLAHEIGHLLLGSNSHSVNGIMSPHWNGPELRRISEGSLLFLPNESRILGEGLRLRKVDIPAVAGDPAPKNWVLGIAVYNDRPQRRYSGLLASLRSEGRQTITTTALDGTRKRIQPH